MTPIERFSDELARIVNEVPNDESPNEMFAELISCALVVAYKSGASESDVVRYWNIALKKAAQLMKE